MRHIQPLTRQGPVRAQMDGNPPVLKALASFLLLGINPLFLLFFNAKTNNDSDNGDTNGQGFGSR